MHSFFEFAAAYKLVKSGDKLADYFACLLFALVEACALINHVLCMNKVHLKLLFNSIKTFELL